MASCPITKEGLDYEGLVQDDSCFGGCHCWVVLPGSWCFRLRELVDVTVFASEVLEVGLS
jgi:hypothetical protein